MNQEISDIHRDLRQGLNFKDLKNLHYCKNYKNSYSLANKEYLHKNINENWRLNIYTLFPSVDFEEFYQNQEKKEIESLIKSSSEKLLQFIQERTDEIFHSYQYYYKINLFHSITNPIKNEELVKLITIEILANTKISFKDFTFIQPNLHQKILNILFSKLILEVKRTKYENFTHLYIKERDRIDQLFDNDFLKPYRDKLNELIQASQILNQKNDYPLINNEEQSLPVSNISYLKIIPKELFVELSYLTLQQIKTNDLNKAIQFLKLKELDSIVFTKPASHLSLIFTFLIIKGFYSKKQIENVFKSRKLKHIDDTKEKAKFNLTKHRSYFNKWVENANGKYIFSEICNKPKIFNDLYSIFNKKY